VNTLLGILNYPLTHQIGWTLLHSLWQGACVGAVFAVLRFVLRRRSANARYVAGCLCLAVLLAAPMLTLLVGPKPSAPPGSGSLVMSTFPRAAAPVLSTGSLLSSYTGGGTYSWWDWGSGFLGQIAPLLATVWLLGVAFFSVRLTRSCWWVRNIRLRDNELVEAVWMETLNDLRRRLGVSRPVRLLKSALVEVPTVIGWFRPVILLPTATLAGLPPGQVEAILAHELAHVRRLDYVVNAFQCLLETLMFYHPVTWWISRCVREERENCCDDLVIQVCGDRQGYARALATLEGFRGGVRDLAFAASGGSLLNRIRRLLGVSSDNGPVSARQVGGLALLGIGLLLIILGVCLAVGPTTYQSTARIRVERDQMDGAALANDRGSPSYDPYFIQTEFEVIESEPILSKVIEDLDLNKEWSKKYANGERLKTPETIALLRARIDLRPVRNTSLIEIRAFSEKPDEAARLANAIAQAYLVHRHEQRMQASRGGIKALEERFAEQEEKVKKAQQQVEKLRVELRISDTAASAEGPAPLMTADTLRKLEALRVETKAEYTRQTTLLERLKEIRQELGPEGLAQVLPTAASDSLLNSLLEQLNLTEEKLVTLEKEFGPGHPEIIKCKVLTDDLHAKIKSRVNGIMLGLDAKVLSSSNSLDNLEKEVERAVTNDVARANQTRPYFEAKRSLEELQRFRQILDMKIANEKIDVEMPKTMMVQVVDRGVPAQRPVSPNLPRALAMIVFGVLLNVAGLLLLRTRPRTDSAPLPA
jgi:uncharacterized protein involved in exopolysaccharide biosynthesis/beta-lactamase regulating signal transducer with metallopeptidase domain